MTKKLTSLAAQAVLPAVVLFAAFAITRALVQYEPEGAEFRPRVEQSFAVTAIDADPKPDRATLRAFGEVVAAESADLRVASPGEVIAIHPDLQVGHVVEAGTALVTIDPFLYAGAVREAEAALAEAKARLSEIDARIALEESALASAGAQLELARTDLIRAQQLAERGATSDRALDDRRLIALQREQATAQSRFTLEAERARRAQQDATVIRLAWQLAKAERALDDTVLVAPFRGIVRAENVAVGRQLQLSDLAVSLIRADARDVRFTLSDQRYGRLLTSGAVEGSKVNVIWRIGDEPLRYSATINRVAADIDRATGGVDIFARLDTSQTEPPRPGAFVEVEVPGRLFSDAVRVPIAALEGGAVYVIDDENRLDARDVTVLVRDGEEVLVRGAIAAGEAIVTSQPPQAGEGILVRRVNPSAPRGGPADALAGQPGNEAEPRTRREPS
mgnify:CR=1 FL=1